jgi:hypothetical protein
VSHEDGTHIARVRIVLEHPEYDVQRASLTDERGCFSFGHVPPGRIVLIVVDKERSGRVFEFDDWGETAVIRLSVPR